MPPEVIFSKRYSQHVGPTPPNPWTNWQAQRSSEGLRPPDGSVSGQFGRGDVALVRIESKRVLFGGVGHDPSVQAMYSVQKPSVLGEFCIPVSAVSVQAYL